MKDAPIIFDLSPSLPFVMFLTVPSLAPKDFTSLGPKLLSRHIQVSKFSWTIDFMNEIFSDFNGRRSEEKTLGIVLSETLNTSIEREIEGIKHPQNQISKFASKLCQKISYQTHSSNI